MLIRCCLLFALLLSVDDAPATGADRFRVATFAADVTIPVGHRCMGVLPTKSRRIADPLEARGFVLLGAKKPIVLLAVDWCEIRNGAYDQWRDALAAAAGTTRECVLVTSLHQHDAPVTDAGAARLLDEVGLSGELYDVRFHAECIRRTVRSLKQSLQQLHPVTHIGTGQARVSRIASSRRVERPGGKVTFGRGSRSGGNAFYRDAPEGEIDPFVKVLSFWNGDKPLVALSVYATHPMSYYGSGEVSADFVGLARRLRQQAEPDVFQIYASGCSGDVTAGKYNDGSAAARVALTQRLAAGMKSAWEATTRVPLSSVSLKSVPLRLPWYKHRQLAPDRLQTVLRNEEATTEDRILAAMSLSSLKRVQSEQPIDLPCVRLGSVKLLLFPGEAFVGYQLMAQQEQPDSFVILMGYGECWPGYIPTAAAFAEGFHEKWLWVAPGSEKRIRAALQELFEPDTNSGGSNRR